MPTDANPSAKWTNFTDGSCQRLIWTGKDTNFGMRYLLGCDAVDCCTESQEGNQLEYQIPNIQNPTKFTYLGKESITQDAPSGTVTIMADKWHWCGRGLASAECFDVHTTGNVTGNAILRRWTVSLYGKTYPTDYYSFKPVPAAELAGFAASFAVPAICAGASACQQEHAEGKLSDKSLAFVRQGLKTETTEMVVSPSFLASKAAAAATHYEDPSAGPCQAGELAVRINGVKGGFCSPSCSAGPCPTDVPAGTNASPECALETQGASRPSRCALICQSSSKCPAKASCKLVQGAIGLCTYDS